MCATEHGPSHQWAQLLDDGHAYDPKVLGGVVFGYVGRGARRVTITGFGERLEAEPDADGFFLAATDRTRRPAAGIHLRIDGKSTRNPGFTPDPVVPGSVRIVARAPDPSGLQPYGLLEWEQRPGVRCTHEGQVVGDMAGAVNPDAGLFFPYPLHEGGACGGGPVPVDFPVAFGFGSGMAERTPERTPEEIARRTLPGRTILRGRAGSNVRRVVLQTPRDVRAFRPGPGGAFLVVYDGTFETGTITVTATLDDGRTVRRSMPVDR